MKSDVIDISAELVHQTMKAVLVKNLKDEEVWLPKSAIEIDSIQGRCINFALPERMAIEKGLV